MAKKTGQRGKKKSHVISNIILVIAIIVFAVALFKIISGQREYKVGRDEYKRLREKVKIEDDNSGGEKGNGIDWNTLKQMNPDIVGWIRFEEPKVIDYPIVQGKDNYEYLHRSFSENAIKAGTIFMNYANKPDFSDRNTFIYGHNMNDGSMFASLRNYEDKSFWEQHKYFYILTPDNKTHKYTVVAAGTYPTEGNAATQYKFSDDKDFKRFVNEIKADRYYDTGIEIKKHDKVVTLYTCTNIRDAERRLVFGVEENPAP